ncbi:hypothetical protein MKX01_017481 [Papaver californicum]|nr:hypothetical protein MKX01_017481 [Papaver californicum]
MVDHLGSVTYRVTDMLDKSVNVVSEAELWASCINQIQILNLISVLIAHVNEINPFANRLVEFFHKIL